MIRTSLLATVGLLALASCTNPTTVTITPSQVPLYPPPVSDQPASAPVSHRPPNEAYRNVGDPKRLLDQTAEQLTIRLESKEDIADLEAMIRRDPPSKVMLGCDESKPLCRQLVKILSARSVSFEFTANADEKVTLVYDRIQARDCDSRYIDNTQNADNLNHPALGCATVANTIQMIGDRRQLTNPSLMDLPDASKAVQSYRRSQQPTKPSDANDDSLIETLSTSQ